MQGPPNLSSGKWTKRYGRYVWIPKDFSSCVHTWTKDCGPRPAVYSKIEYHYYICTECGRKECSTVLIPIEFPPDNTCNHYFQSDPKLGIAYSMFQVCTKCGKQTIK